MKQMAWKNQLETHQTMKVIINFSIKYTKVDIKIIIELDDRNLVIL